MTLFQSFGVFTMVFGFGLALAACDGEDPVNGTDNGMPMTGDDNGVMQSAARGRDNPPSVGTQIDRNGRPGISTAAMATFTPDETRNARRAAYAAADDPADWAADFTGDISSTLAILDSLDTNCGNQLLAGDTAEAGRYDGLAGVLADDRLYVNAASGENGGNLYLGVEAQAVGALEDGGAGGRRPSDDVIERSYSVLAAGILAGIDDTIATDDDGELDDDNFPFLDTPL